MVAYIRRPGLYADGAGLYLRVDNTGAKRRDMGLGSLSTTSLSEARQKAQRYRSIAREGGDPIAERHGR